MSDRPGRRRVLVVSYYSPPWGGPQSLNVAQLIRLLPDAGWTPKLLTARAELYGEGTRDPSSHPDFRRDAIETSALAPERLVPMLKEGSSGEASAGGGHGTGSVGGHSLTSSVAALLATPDRLIGWLPFALWRGLRAARRSAVIYAPGPPATNFVVAAVLARLARRPLVVCFEDPWVGMPHRTWYGETQRRLHAGLERRVVDASAAVLAGTQGFLDDLISRHPDQMRDKGAVKLWGFEPGDTRRGERPPPPPLRLIYAGSLRGEQYDPGGLFAALESLLAENPGLTQRLSLDVYSDPDPAYRRAGSRGALSELVRFHGFRPHREITAVLSRAHAAVLLIGDSHPQFGWYHSAKLFTYAATRCPILALVPPEGEAASLVRQYRLGLVAAPSDPAGIARAIRELADRHAAIAASMADPEPLSAVHAISGLARQLDRVASI